MTTSSASTGDLVSKFGDPVRGVMISAVFKAVGLNGARWENFDEIGKSGEKERKEFLDRVRRLI
ncbi:hypothetical protein [Cloacibacillus sp. An23]|uniref:hypothetical protein n=1 Tax=Cloacibacillus sp. An23 TaxID=1965591 RepID=UPI000B395E77|nr:hypothetical protein [Cloacibacillus sp. An23]OUO93311.1 hypothetical protein B5F39_08430 [Cloacibacillus sp. An23]